MQSGPTRSGTTQHERLRLIRSTDCSCNLLSQHTHTYTVMRGSIKMKKFVEPEIEILDIEVVDIVTTSILDIISDDIGWG